MRNVSKNKLKIKYIKQNGVVLTYSDVEYNIIC